MTLVRSSWWLHHGTRKIILGLERILNYDLDYLKNLEGVLIDLGKTEQLDLVIDSNL